MVQICVKTATPGATPEWTLIELQGMLESPESDELAGNFIGDLHFNQKGAPIFIIGHHILYGKFVTLDKPYLVLLKETPHDVAMETDQQMTSDTNYNVSAVIKRKIIFKTRPKPIITNVAKKV